jgi:hypothetical protein
VTDAITTFLREVQQLPKFIEAAQADEKWLQHFEQMETGLHSFAQSDLPQVIDVFDQILQVIKRSDWSLKQKLLEVSRLAAVVRDGGRSVQ